MFKETNGKGRRICSSTRLLTLSKIALAVGLSNMELAFAGSCSVGSASDLGTALSNTSCSNIVFTQNITLTTWITAAFGDRTDITIDGNGYSLNSGNYYITASSSSTVTDNVNLNLINFNAISSTATRTNDPIIYVSDQNSHINVSFDNITQMPNNTIAIVSKDATSGANNQNPYSKLIIGNITNLISIKLDTYKQLANAIDITFTGKAEIETTGGGSNSYSYIFWSNSPITGNKVTFNQAADVSMKLASGDRFTTGDGHGKGYAYYFDDGAKFLLWSQQNVFGNSTGSNVGVKIGSYDKTTQTFGLGSIIEIAGVNGATLTGDGLTNRGGTVGAIDNGADGADDVVFNLAKGSNFNVTGAGIVVDKNAGNTSGIYVRSATDIMAATGIEITHNGTGDVVVANNGSITSTVAGMEFLSSSNNTMLVDFTDGTINASGGDAITVGSSTGTGTANLTIDNGTINISGAANALNFTSSGTSNQHAISGLTINASSGLTGKIIANNNAKVTLTDSNINIVDSTAFTDTDLSNITFAQGTDDKNNVITVTGSGVGVTSSNDLSSLQDSYLTLNVTDTTGTVGTTGTGTAIKITGGNASDAIVVNNNLIINASNATALDIGGSLARQFTNNGVITGDILFNNGTVDNTITNNGTLNGNVTTGAGNNALLFSDDSKSLGTVTLGNGNNTVTIGDNTYVNEVIAGSGNDTFNLSNLTKTSTNYIGILDAGAGTNTLNLSNSSLTVDSNTFFKNFHNINLNTSNLVLLNKDNLSSGNLITDVNSSLSFSNSYNDSVGFTLGGTGQVNINESADVTLNQDNTAFSGKFVVADNGTLNTTAIEQLGSASLNLLGTLNATQNELDNQLTGTGTINIDTQNTIFNFTNKVGSAFTGLVNLVDTQFNLAADNTTTLTNATLQVSDASSVTVGSNSQSIGNLTLNGGSLTYINTSGTIDTSSLAVTESSQIKVNVSTINNSGNIIDQTSGQQTQLINSSNSLTSSDLAKFTLQDLNGNQLVNDNAADITQNNTIVAVGSYNYGLSGVNGLGIVNTLTKVDIQNNQTLALDTTNALTRNFTAQIIGSGNLTLTTDTTGLTLTNEASNYTGGTTVNTGKVILGSNNALGQTSELEIASSAGADLNGKNQTIGSLANAGELALSGGNLTITDGGSSTGTLSGSGALNVNGGDLTISTANVNLTANTNITNGASVTLDNTGTLGTGNIAIAGDLNLNATNNNLSNSLSGAGNINTGTAITLTGDNSSFTGQQNINSNGTLTINNANNLGSSTAKVNLNNTNSALNLSGVTDDIANQLIGAAGSVNINSNSNLSLTGDNSQFKGNYALSGNSTLNVSNSNNLDESDVDIDSGSTLILNSYNNGSSTELANSLTGTGNLTLSGSKVTLTTDNSNASGLAGNITLQDNSSLTVNNENQLNNSASINIASTADELNINSSGAYTLNNVLSGNGTINVDTDNNTFNLSDSVGVGFSGTLNIKDAQFALSGDNTTALTNSTLQLSGGTTVVGANDQNIGNIDFNGGTLVFNGDGAIKTGSLSTTSNNSIVQINENNIPSSDLNLSGNILDQNVGDIKELITAQAGSALDVNKITLQDASGNALTSASQHDIEQNNTIVADATYDYTLVNNNGLGVSYTLTALDLKAGKTLDLDATVSTNKTLTAQLTGVGNLSIKSDSTGITLDNTNNSYTGKTTLETGTQLTFGSNNALGQTSELEIASSAGADLNGKNQTIGSLANAGELALSGGNLTITDGGSSTGTLSGSGALNVNGGILNISGSNTLLSANTQINNATVNISSAQALGSGGITLNNATDSHFNINNVTGSLQNKLAGSGIIDITGSTIALAGDNTGLSNASTIQVDSASKLFVTVKQNLGESALNFDQNGVLNINSSQNWELTNTITGAGVFNKTGAGSISITGDHVTFDNTNINDGSLLIKNGKLTTQELYVGSSGYLIGGTNGVLSGNVTNVGNIYISNDSLTKTLSSPISFEITGNLNNTGNVYLSNANSSPQGNTLNVLGDLNGDGNYYIRTQLSQQQGDLINVVGAVNGNNTLSVQDTGSEPISASSLKVVQSGSAGTGDFTLQNGTVDLGTYRYGLQHINNNWYLAPLSSANVRLSKAADSSVGMRSATASMWEEELGTLNSRMGDMRLDNNYEGGVWVRQLSHDLHATPNSSAAYQQQYNGSQVGVDKAFAFDGGKFYLGVMTGLSRITLSFKEGASGSIKSQTFGIYGTTLFDNGYYIDTVLKYGHMKNKIDYHDNTGSKVKANYHTDAFGLSMEGGKRFTFQNTWFIEPQLQLTASHLQGKNYSYDNDAEVKSHSMQLFNGRVGIVAGNKYTFKQVVIEPYVEISHIQEFSGKGKVIFNNNRLNSDQVGTRQHYGLGLNANVAQKHNFFINASYESGNKMEQPWGIKAGYQFRF